MSGDDIPVTWSALLADDLDLLREDLEAIEEVPAEIEVVRPPWLRSGRFSSPALSLAHAAVVLGAEACRPGIEILLPLLPVALRDFENGIDNTNRGSAQHLLSFFNTTACCGIDLPVTAEGAAHEWPSLLAQFAHLVSDTERQTLALAAIINGHGELIPSIIGSGALDQQFVPGVTFDFNVQGFIRYLAVAYRDRVAFADVEPAWLNFVHRFPHKRAARTVEWCDLLYVARIVDTLHPERTDETTADKLHELVSGYR